jgi:hypothetical protein
MPLLKDKFSMLFRKLLGARKFTHLQSKRLAQFYAVFDVEDGFAAAVSNVDMQWPVFVAVKRRIDIRPFSKTFGMITFSNRLST